MRWSWLLLAVAASGLIYSRQASAQDLARVLDGEPQYEAQPLLEVAMNPQQRIGSRSIEELATDLGIVNLAGDDSTALVDSLVEDQGLQYTGYDAEGDWNFVPKTVFSKGAPFAGDQEVLVISKENPALFLANMNVLQQPDDASDFATIGIEDYKPAGNLQILVPALDGSSFDVFAAPRDGVLTIGGLSLRTVKGALPIALVEKSLGSHAVKPLNARTPERRGTGGIAFKRTAPLGIKIAPTEQLGSGGKSVRFSLLDGNASSLLQARPSIPVYVQNVAFYDQLGSQACAAFATCLALDYTFARQHSHFIFRADPLRLLTSPQFLYYHTGLLEFADADESFRCSAGRTLEGVKFWLSHDGVETYFSLGLTNFNAANTCTVPAEPSADLSDSPFFVPSDVVLFDLGSGGIDIAGMKRLLTDSQRFVSRPIVALIPIDGNFFQVRQEVGSRENPWLFNGQKIAYHAVTLVGYEDGFSGKPGAFLLRNSWGSDWKLDGYCWVDYRMFDGPNPRKFDYEGFVIGPLQRSDHEVARHFQ